jgi:capsular polysaccharide biosynthesis protein
MSTSTPPVFSETNFYFVLKRYWLLVLTPVVVGVAIASLLSFGRTPVYTSQARLTIGSLNISTQGIPGFVYAAQGLAGAYSRVVTADGVVDPVAKQLHLSRTNVINDLSGSPTPNSPIFLVEGKGDSPQKAIALTNAAANQLKIYIGKFNSISTGENAALLSYQNASSIAADAKLSRDSAQKLAFAHPNAANKKRALSASSAYDVAKGKQLVALSIYTGAATGHSGANLIQVIAPANKADSDRSSKALIFFLAAIVAGLVIGLSLAVTRDYGRRQAALAE